MGRLMAIPLGMVMRRFPVEQFVEIRSRKVREPSR